VVRMAVLYELLAGAREPRAVSDRAPVAGVAAAGGGPLA